MSRCFPLPRSGTEWTETRALFPKNYAKDKKERHKHKRGEKETDKGRSKDKHREKKDHEENLVNLEQNPAKKHKKEKKDKQKDKGKSKIRTKKRKITKKITEKNHTRMAISMKAGHQREAVLKKNGVMVTLNSSIVIAAMV